MDDGLTIEENEFMKLAVKKQMTIIFKNQVEILKAVKSYKLHQKIQYGAIAGIMAIGAFICNKIFLK